MRKGIKLTMFLLITLNGISCRQSMKPAAYARYVSNQENGLKKILKTDGWEFVIQYRPYDYIMLMENTGNVAGYNFDKRKSELKGTAWFNISIKRADNSISPLRYGVASIEEYNNRLNYFLNEAANDIKLTYDKDTLRPVSYLFENNYNLSPQETIVVGFYLPKGNDWPQRDMRITFADRIFKNGIINAGYPAKTLRNIPTLVY